MTIYFSQTALQTAKQQLQCHRDSLLIKHPSFMMVFRGCLRLAVAVFGILEFLIPGIVETIDLVSHDLFNLCALLSDEFFVGRVRCDDFCNG